jgi:hypothetical protein
VTARIVAVAFVAALGAAGCRFDIRGLGPAGDAGAGDALVDAAADRGGDARDAVGPPGDAADAAVTDGSPAEGGPADAAQSDAAQSDAAQSDAAQSDAAQSDAAQSDAAQSDAAVVPFCASTNPDLVACYRFEGNLQDGSSYGNHGTAANVTYPAGVGGQAVGTGATSYIAVPEDASLDCPSAITIEAWIWPQSLSSTARAGIVDNDGQYGLFVHPGGEVRCSAGGGWVTAAGAAVVGQWQHLACVYDGAAIKLYRNGVQVAALVQAGGIPTGGLLGLRLGMNSPSGDNFTGLIDGLRIWRVARSAAELCTRTTGDCG